MEESYQDRGGFALELTSTVAALDKRPRDLSIEQAERAPSDKEEHCAVERISNAKSHCEEPDVGCPPLAGYSCERSCPIGQTWFWL